VTKNPVQENETTVSSSFDSRQLFQDTSVGNLRNPPQPPPHSDATTIMVAILVVVVTIASVLTNTHAYISARGDLASKFEIIAKT